jgi:MSHA pilin protein MshD
MRKLFGFTLIEILVTIVVISIAATALLSVFSGLVRGSADPIIQQQATTIAEAYMEEIMLKSFDDPQLTESGSDEGEGADRSIYNDVQDYNSLATTEVRRQDNTPIAALNAFSVTVTVGGAMLNVTVPAMRINVNVTHAAISNITLTAYRTQY